MRTPNEWRKHLQGKSPSKAAEMIIGDLLGYRKTSLKRSDDHDNVTFAVEAMRPAWQPMATAPTEPGRRFLAKLPDGHVLVVLTRNNADTQGQWTTETGVVIQIIAGWQELPE